MKKINVNQNTCIGCGACVAIDNEHFDFNEEGKSTVISNENVENNANLTNAVESCPVAAISVEEAGDSKCTCSPDCTCGCQDGQECSCDGNCQCDDNCHCGDDCHCDNNCHC